MGSGGYGGECACGACWPDRVCRSCRQRSGDCTSSGAHSDASGDNPGSAGSAGRACPPFVRRSWATRRPCPRYHEPWNVNGRYCCGDGAGAGPQARDRAARRQRRRTTRPRSGVQETLPVPVLAAGKATSKCFSCCRALRALNRLRPLRRGCRRGDHCRGGARDPHGSQRGTAAPDEGARGLVSRYGPHRRFCGSRPLRGIQAHSVQSAKAAEGMNTRPLAHCLYPGPCAVRLCRPTTS